MSNSNSPISGSRPGPIQVPAPGLRPSNFPAHAPRPRKAPSKSRLNPFDLASAFQRLQQLLTNDNSGEPRSDVPARGFYLNILV